MEFWIPKGANLFHFVGGARFVHGGAMPQEIVVPVVTVKQVEGKSAQGTKIRAVSVHVLGTNHRITTACHRFQLIQMEPVSDRVKSVTLKIAVFEGDEPVTAIETVKFDSTSGQSRRAEEMGQPRPEGTALRQEDAVPARSARRRNRDRAAERRSDYRQGVHR